MIGGLAPPRRREVPDAREPHLRPPHLQGAVLLRARDHVYNTIRPILHEPGPIGNGTFATLQGVPITEGEVLRRVAVHDNHNLHVASMGFWSLWVVPDETVERCGPMPSDMVDINRAEALRPDARTTI